MFDTNFQIVYLQLSLTVTSKCRSTKCLNDCPAENLEMTDLAVMSVLDFQIDGFVSESFKYRFFWYVIREGKRTPQTTERPRSIWRS